MKVTFNWAKTVTQQYTTTIKIRSGADLDDWDFGTLAQEIDDDCIPDDIDLISQRMYDMDTDYDVDEDSIDTISDDPPVMPSALCTSP